MLTKKQKELLLFIHERMRTGEIAPSFDEMREALGLKSKSGIHRLITALVERGYLQRLPNRARALEIKRLPEGVRESADLSSIDGGGQAEGGLTLPLHGKIAAGTPIEAIRHEHETIQIPPDMVSARAEHYALNVDGDSMINAGIHDGDTVIIEKCDQARDGEIVVALVDGEEVTLKRLKRENGQVLLIPENDAYDTRTLSADRVQIQGRLSALMRTYH